MGGNHLSLIEEIKKRLSILDAAERFTDIDLSRVNVHRRTVNVRCPFHEDRSPSFTLWLDSDRWKCWAGCGQGDQIDLVAKAKGLTVAEAVDYLAGTLLLTPDKPRRPLKEKPKPSPWKVSKEYDSLMTDVYRRLKGLEAMITQAIASIKTERDLEEIGEFYHAIGPVGYILDTLVEGDEQEQYDALWEGVEVLKSWGM